jgi:hypothetical protein
MNATYRKRGASVRWENGVLVRVVESGIAIERDGELVCRPAGAEPLPLPPSDSVLATVAVVKETVKAPLQIERLVVAEGVAEHQYGDRTWQERALRTHVSIVAGRERALVHVGGHQVDDVLEVVEALSRCDGVERPAPPQLRLAPRVTAGLLPSLAGIAPPNVQLFRSAGASDGRGADVQDHLLRRGPWPNWYRPSYRTRPVRMPFDLRLECDVSEIDAGRPRAVALLAPPRGLRLRVLVDDGERAFPAVVRVVRIDAVSHERRWYPFGAGSFGAELML